MTRSYALKPSNVCVGGATSVRMSSLAMPSNAESVFANGQDPGFTGNPSRVGACRHRCRELARDRSIEDVADQVELRPTEHER
jgi:hypothetical protein